MHVTTLLGSPRKSGNTATVLGWTEDALKASGHTVDRVYLDDKSIRGCLGCNQCKDDSEHVACVRKDDGSVVL